MLTNQKLGLRVFYYYLSQKLSAGIILLVIAFIVSNLKSAIFLKLVYLLPLNMATNITVYFIKGLYIFSILLIIFSLIISWIKYISCDFTLGENAFSIRRGIFTKKEVFIPYRQVENINIEQSFNFKMMGVSKLLIQTAGSDANNDGQAEGVFDVIDSKIAITIREFMLQKTSTQVIC